MSGDPTNAVQALNSGVTAYQANGGTLFLVKYWAHLAGAYADLGRFDEAWHSIREGTSLIETTGERWCEAEVNRVAGEIALKSPEHDVAKAQAYFERALSVARKQQAKSWELRAAMSMARLWRDQGKRDEACDRQRAQAVLDAWVEGQRADAEEEARFLHALDPVGFGHWRSSSRSR